MGMGSPAGAAGKLISVAEAKLIAAKAHAKAFGEKAKPVAKAAAATAGVGAAGVAAEEAREHTLVEPVQNGYRVSTGDPAVMEHLKQFGEGEEGHMGRKHYTLTRRQYARVEPHLDKKQDESDDHHEYA